MTTANGLRFKMDEVWCDVPDGVETFGGLREWVIDHFKGRGLILLGTLNGEAAVTQQEAAEWAGRRIADFETLEFLSAEPTALAKRTCADMRDFLDRLGDRAQQTARDIEGGDLQKAFQGVRDCAEGWSLVLQSYRDLLRLSGTDPTTVEMEGRSLTAVAHELRELLERMSQEVGRRDMSQIRELLLDELALYIDPMREGFERIREELN